MAAGILQYDVFTDRPLTGNQLAVFTETAGLTADDNGGDDARDELLGMHVRPPAERPGTDVRLRIFGRGGEMPFAGHPVIGSTFALADDGVIAAGTKSIHVRPRHRADARRARMDSGDRLRVCVDDAADAGVRRRRCRDAGARGRRARPRRLRAAARRAAAGGDLRLGRSSCVPLVSRAAVDQAALDPRALAAVFEAAKLTRRGLFVFSTEAGPDGATVYSRMMGADEDPATGSASGPLGCYLVRHGLVPPTRPRTIVSAQGVKMGRPSRMHIRIDAEPPARSRGCGSAAPACSSARAGSGSS